jgi:hypothetical protein
MGATMSWPGFINLFGAWFFLAAIPLIVLYFLKLRRPRMEVPSLVLWQSVVNDQRVNSPFQKFRRNLLLLLQLLALALLVLALMQPFLAAGPEVAEYRPLLIDCSASMSAVDEATGKSRLDAVKEQIRDQIDSLAGGQKLALFSFATTGRRLTEFTDDRRTLLQALENVQPTHLPSRLDDVLRMAAAFTRTYPIKTVTVLTDGNLPDRVDFELPFDLELRSVAPGGPNVGLTEMSARRSGPEEWEVFVRASGSDAELRGAELQLYEDGVRTATEQLEVSADEAERLVFPVAADKLRLVEARLVPAGFDSLAIDDSVWLTLPAARPLQIRVAPQLASWRHALRVLPNVEVKEAGSEEAGSDVDLIVTDSEAAGGVATVQVFVGVVPQELADIVQVVDEASYVVDWNRTAPLLRHVQLGDVQLGQLPKLAEGRAVKDLEDRGFEVLIDGKSGPLLLQRRQGLQVSFWFLFHTDKSTLPYRVGFPILAANAAEAALKQAALSEVHSAPTGVLPPIAVVADGTYTLKTPDGESLTATASADGLLEGLPASRAGRYDVLDGTELVTSIGTGLLNGAESSLKTVDKPQFTESAVTAQPLDELEADQPLWRWLALLAFGLLLFEWWYFQRARGVIT